ncbi:MAG: cysteine synthase A [Alloprevotella sp.]|nr:cysteine synthase A [Alloprevotella sp.]
MNTTLLNSIGHTPLVALNNLSSRMGLRRPLLAKVERANPGGSVKDRVAVAMIEAAERKGLLHPGAIVIEPTSGNTGVGLAMVCAARGYHLILTMPETMSIERQRLAQAYGAEIRLTPGSAGMQGAARAARELQQQLPGAIIPDQFSNPANPDAHYRGTGPELWCQTNGDIDIFVAGVGTGGTLCGTGRYLKEQKADIRLVAVEPASSPVLSGGQAGPHLLQGIGAGFIPANYCADLVDEIVGVQNEEAFTFARRLAHEEGLLCGISSGAALAAALSVATRKENADRQVVVLLPDTGERYLSTGVFDED